MIPVIVKAHSPPAEQRKGLLFHLATDADATVVAGLPWGLLLDLAEPTGRGAGADATKSAHLPSVQDRFESLLREWRQATRLHSSWHRRTQHPSYLRIIGLGPTVLPHLIRENCRRPDDWNWALVALTGEHPAAGSPDRASAARAWQDWAVAAGIIRDDDAQ